jgi:2-desacetyl-2-hydroxyethyl bacteriochlorophyllide A dehydrogenase
MQAAFAAEGGQILVREVATPVPSRGEVLVRVESCGICGSDLHWFHGQMAAPAVCPGHEIAGAVAAVGPEVAHLRAGDRVALEGIAACGECGPCAAGDYHYCCQIRYVGLGIPGGFAEYLTIPARHCFVVPPGTDAATAALSEPLAVAVHGVRIAGLSIGQRVLVLGAGTIGLAAIVAARAGGAGEIIATARRPHQRAAALALGADAVLDAGDDAALMTAVKQDPIDLVIESVGGTADTLDDAVYACRFGGTICLLGVYTKAVEFPAIRVVAKEITLKGSLVYNRVGARADFEIVQDLLRRHGDLLGRTLVTHRYPLAEIHQAFATAADKATGCIKVSITP